MFKCKVCGKNFNWLTVIKDAFLERGTITVCRKCYSSNAYMNTPEYQELSKPVPEFVTEEIESGMKKCPFCAEKIQYDAIKCRYCGEMLTKFQSPAGQNDTSPFMIIGILLLIIGLIFTIYFYAVFETSVEVPKTSLFGETIGGGRVNNLGLMQERQNGIIISISAVILGTILLIFKSSRNR